ncbi:enoyl-CoA hydratase [Methylocystis parvus]|uniref:Enoyl-CoA hydratase domain-containing protein 3, mitochondrial n=1 Tax=Methylocystis parvus TaxID=134 RepID=A0A6B8LYG3_9HYPH|nr:enoyl-CoA hydratase [Methylocystis parvus]QGM96504.1 enoyl-CoA hydratase [Methylocystis parvus]WBJ99646.1 enoyl-CoA hydratase [Methylocystis parvus OBBP]
MTADLVLCEKSEQVATLTLNSPASRNALSLQLLGALSANLRELAAQDDIRVVILQAEGPAFCAGHDLKELTAHRNDPDRGRAFFETTMRACSSVMQQIVSLPIPVIAAVDEMATAAGCQLVASCDLAVAGPHARFCTPGVDIGLFCSTPAVALSRNVAPKHAMEMLLTGVPIGAEAALRIGLVNRVEVEGARTGARTLAEEIARKSPQAIRFGKRAFYAQREKPLAEAYEMASAVMAENMLAEDAKEGIAAFLEKRAPHWPEK